MLDEEFDGELFGLVEDQDELELDDLDFDLDISEFTGVKELGWSRCRSGK